MATFWQRCECNDRGFAPTGCAEIGEPTKNGIPVKDDGKKLVDAKKDAKEKPTIDLRVSKTRHTPNAGLDGAPIPPAPSGFAINGSGDVVIVNDTPS